MLHTTAVESTLLDLLTSLFKNPELSSYYLVGGTSLALQIGHRHSIDIDLFTQEEISDSSLLPMLKGMGTISLIKKSKHIQSYFVNGIKVDFVSYPYPWISHPFVEGIYRLAFLPDIGAMKLNAITGRGSKKDFVDLYFLLQQYSLRDMMAFYRQKYPEGSEFLVLKSLCYFGDAEPQPLPRLIQTTSWEEIKNTILESVRIESME